jgi:MFS family permease
MQGVLVGPSINRFGEDRLILASLVTTALGFVLLTRAWNFGSLAVLVTFNMAGGAFLRPSISSIVSKRTPTGQGATMGVVGSFDSLGRIAGPLLAGWLYQYSMNLPYYVGAAVTMVGVGFVLPTVLRGRTSSEPAARG